MDLSHFGVSFLDPPREFGPIPFWFWNDDLDEGELIRQLHAFHRAGFGGILPQARIGLSRRVGYLTEEYFRLLRRVVEEAARLGMKVILYDEASYPSGSAKGAVVAANPDFASQAIGLWVKEIEGPFAGYWRPNTGRSLLDRHLCTLLGQVNEKGQIEPDSVRLLPSLPRTLFHLEVGTGKWKAMSVWHTFSGGHIRGAFADEEDGSATAPPSADLLNPQAVSCFLRLTHDQYYQHLKDFFGDPIIALFTDEPNLLGRNAQRPPDPRPYTPGFLEWLAARWGQDPRPWLPALWLDYGPGTEEFRKRYAAALQERLRQVFYAAQSAWCAAHGIALTGHPSGSNEMSCLRLFQIPGQDIVWRYIAPGQPSALEGPHSVTAKAATSAARLNCRRRILTEVGGAFGWRLTLDELKWLFDWHLVRGNNLISPHAAFYSIRERRAWESEPDLGIHNLFWPYFPVLATYARRLSWLLSDGEQVCEVAILGDGDALPWQAARQLYQNQIDFLYLDDEAVAESQVQDKVLVVGSQRYRAVVIDGVPLLSEKARSRLEEFARRGGLLLHFQEGMDLPARLDQQLSRDLRLDPPHPDLRFIHYQKEGLDLYLLVDEGEAAIAGELTLGLSGALAGWDPLTGRTIPLQARSEADTLRLPLTLERRQSLVLAIDRRQPFVPPSPPPRFREFTLPLELAWTVRDLQSKKVDLPAPGDWSHCPGWELFSGTLRYSATIEIPAADELVLDLGQVGDIAEVWLDGQPAGLCLWAPYRLELEKPLVPGSHQLEIRVTNTLANECEGIQAPSGLIGPLRLIARTLVFQAEGVSA